MVVGVLQGGDQDFYYNFPLSNTVQVRTGATHEINKNPEYLLMVKIGAWVLRVTNEAFTCAVYKQDGKNV